MKLIKLPDGWDVMPFDELQKKMIVPPLPGGVGDSNKAGAKPKAKRNPSLSHVCNVCSNKYDRADRLSAHMFNKHGSTTTTQHASTTTTQLTTGQHSSHSGFSTAQPTAVAHLQQQQQEFVCPLGMFVYYDEEVEEVDQVEEAEEAEDPLAA